MNNILNFFFLFEAESYSTLPPFIFRWNFLFVFFFFSQKTCCCYFSIAFSFVSNFIWYWNIHFKSSRVKIYDWIQLYYSQVIFLKPYTPGLKSKEKLNWDKFKLYLCSWNRINISKSILPKLNIRYIPDKIAWLSTLRLLHKQAIYRGLLHVGSYVWYVTVIMFYNFSLSLSLYLSPHTHTHTQFLRVSFATFFFLI